MMQPRIRVSGLLRRGDKLLLCRHEKAGHEYWLLPGGGVDGGETLVRALRRELSEEVGLTDDFPLEGPVAICESISPVSAAVPRHVVHIIFAGHIGERSLEQAFSRDAAVRNHRLFSIDELAGIALHPPIHRFLARWQPGDPVVYLGALWAP
jgi:ADP-ribose pyrophosphatase YjhB (NUDIX family)